MGAGASTATQEDIKHLPQYKLAGGDAKYDELKDEMGMISLTSIEDPYLRFGGSYSEDPKNTKDFKYVHFESVPHFTPAHRSALARHLTTDIFDRLKDSKTGKGYTLSNVIMTGVVTPHLLAGATAGDEESWDVFKDLLHPIVRDLHGFDPSNQAHSSDMDAGKLVFSDEQKELFDKHVLSTRIRASRNITGTSFTPGMTAEERAQVENLLKESFAAFEGDLAGAYRELSSIDDADKEAWSALGVMFDHPTARSMLTGAGAARSWPDHRGVFLNDAKNAACWVNEEDHCRVISADKGGDIVGTFKRFVELSDSLKASVEKNNAKIAYRDDLGYVGACPSNVGTALRASVIASLPEFGKLAESSNVDDKHLLERVAARLGLQVRGAAGENTVPVDGKFDLSNKDRIGSTEVELVQKVVDGVTQIIKLEHKLAAGASTDSIRAEFEIPATPQTHVVSHDNASSDAPAAEVEAAPAVADSKDAESKEGAGDAPAPEETHSVPENAESKEEAKESGESKEADAGESKQDAKEEHAANDTAEKCEEAVTAPAEEAAPEPAAEA